MNQNRLRNYLHFERSDRFEVVTILATFGTLNGPKLPLNGTKVRANGAAEPEPLKCRTFATQNVRHPPVLG